LRRVQTFGFDIKAIFRTIASAVFVHHDHVILTDHHLFTAGEVVVVDGQGGLAGTAQTEHDKADVFQSAFFGVDPQNLASGVEAEAAALLPVIERHP